MSLMNIEQLEAHVLHIDFRDQRKVESVTTEYAFSWGRYIMTFVVKDGENTTKYTLPVYPYNLLNPESANQEALYAEQIRRWVVGEPQFYWMPFSK